MGCHPPRSQESAVLLVFPRWQRQDGVFLFPCSVFGLQPGDTIFFFHVFVRVSSPCPFSLVRSLSWKIDVAGCFFNYLAWSIPAALEPKGGFHHKGKDITFTVKKGLYLMSSPPSFPSREQQQPRKGGEAVLGAAATPRGACWPGRAMSIPLPSPALFSCIIVFPLGGQKIHKVLP